MLSKAYDPKSVEAKWSGTWQKEKLFISKPQAEIEKIKVRCEDTSGKISRPTVILEELK